MLHQEVQSKRIVLSISQEIRQVKRTVDKVGAIAILPISVCTMSLMALALTPIKLPLFSAELHAFMLMS